MKITKTQLRRIIKEEKARLIKEQPPSMYIDPNPGKDDMYRMDDELKELGAYINHMNHYALRAAELTQEMSMRYGELSTILTYSNEAQDAAAYFKEQFDIGLEELAKTREYE